MVIRAKDIPNFHFCKTTQPIIQAHHPIKQKYIPEAATDSPQTDTLPTEKYSPFPGYVCYLPQATAHALCA